MSLGLAHGIGVQLSRESGRWMWVVTITSVFNALAYTGGPYPLGYVVWAGCLLGTLDWVIFSSLLILA